MKFQQELIRLKKNNLLLKVTSHGSIKELKKAVLFWILKKKRQNIGYIRLDRKLNKYYLSYLISKNHRDKKYGTSIIEMMLKKKEVKIILEKKFHLIAVSKKKNKKSIFFLLKNNFNQIYKSRNTLTLQYDNS